jgi:hypothetical protein
VVSEAKHEFLYLDLKYKKLWFRLAYPKGRIKKTALKITEQIAVIEAKVFLHKDDVEPVSSFIATRNINDKSGTRYIQLAQDAAENQALIDAGFGLQFGDISQGVDAEPLDTGVAINQASVPVNTTDVPVNTAVVLPEKVEEKTEAPITETTSIVEEPPVEELSVAEQKTEESPVVKPVVQIEEQTVVQPIVQPIAQSTAEAVTEILNEGIKQKNPIKTMPVSTYTADMSVDDIAKTMTLDEARGIVVDSGTCEGWKLSEVAEKRQASLKWYLNGYPGKNNVLKAGAKVLLEHINQTKAA